jgi:hypothetical protein
MIDALPPRTPGAYPVFPSFLPASPVSSVPPASAPPSGVRLLVSYALAVVAATRQTLQRILAWRLVRALSWLAVRLVVGVLAVGVLLGIANLTVATLVTLYAHVTPYTGAG